MLKRISAVLMVLLMLFALSSCTVSESDIAEIADLADSYLAAETDDAQSYASSAEAEDAATEDESPSETISAEAVEAEATEAQDSEAEYEESEYTEVENPESEESYLETQDEAIADNQELLDENGTYDSKEDVALYIHQYGHLPDNYITKKEAQALGWPGGSLEPYAPGKCIGGTYFGNYEGILPTADGREYHECDIDTLGASSRGAKRIVFSNDGLIYYTEDHYETFELLYGDDSQ